MVHVECVGMFMTSPYTVLHDTLQWPFGYRHQTEIFIQISRGSHIFVLHATEQRYLHKNCIFLENLLHNSIPEPYIK